MGVEQPLFLHEDVLPAIPSGWVWSRSDSLVIQRKPGKLFDTKTVAATGAVPVLNQSEIGVLGYHDEEPGVVASAGAPVVTFANHTCAMRLVKYPFSAIQNIFPKVGKQGECDTVWFYYALLGRVRTNEYKGHHPLFRDAFVPVPPLAVQRRIASILSAYDDLIENSTRRIAILEEMARRIYEEWFVRFRFPGHEGVRMVESELGLVPEGWSLRRLGDEIELAYGKALKAEDRRLGDVPVYGSSGVVGAHDLSLVAAPGIIVGRKGNVGSVHWSEVPFFPIDTVYYVVTDLPLHYVYFNLQRQNFLNNDAAVPGLNRNQAYSLPLIVPARGVLDGFEGHCRHLLGLARLLARKNDNLRATRDLLLPKLISGELDVSVVPEPEALAA